MISRLIYIIKYTKISLYYFCYHLYGFVLSLTTKPKNQVIFSASRKNKYSENPKYISETLHKINPDIKIIWLLSSKEKYNLPDYINVVYFDKLNNKQIIRLFAETKVWVTSHLLSPLIYKSKKQLFINTWHGGLGIKTIQLDVKMYKLNPYRRYHDRYTGKIVDIFLSNSKHLSDVYKTAFRYKGKILKSGFPKNDITISNNIDLIKDKVKKFYDIDNDSKIILYAPTHRDVHNNDCDYLKQILITDFTNIIDYLNNNTSNKYVVIVKLHPFIDNYYFDKLFSNVIDGSQYNDMQELIMASDIFISDYSSAIFDAALYNIPSFIYAKDYDTYIKERGVYIDINKLPFDVSDSYDKLCDDIISFNINAFMDKWNAFIDEQELLETGHASRDVANLINGYINQNQSTKSFINDI